MSEETLPRTARIISLAEVLMEAFIKQPVKEAVHEAMDEQAEETNSIENRLSETKPIDRIPRTAILLLIGLTAVTLYRKRNKHT